MHGNTRARVLAQHRGHWLISDGPRLAVARRLPESPVTGDWVELDAAGVISAICERHGTLTRLDPGGGSQVLAANVDLALIVEALPDPNVRRAERLAALAESGGVPAVLVLTKSDLSGPAEGDEGDEAHEVAARLARRLGLVDSVAVSAATGEGLDALRQLFVPGRTVILLGLSGAGKSTLVNALLGEERQATGAVRASDGRGRHTTVTRELIPLPGGAFVIDTPGLRAVALWDPGEAFADIDALAAGCRFADCRHEAEPGCAVRDAVTPERLDAWRRFGRAEAWASDRAGTQRERKRWGREIARANRRS
jgi:ribosome biogenesis GTPase / thiamine phosphate phosphatase